MKYYQCLAHNGLLHFLLRTVFLNPGFSPFILHPQGNLTKTPLWGTPYDKRLREWQFNTKVRKSKLLSLDMRCPA